MTSKKQTHRYLIRNTTGQRKCESLCRKLSNSPQEKSASPAEGPACAEITTTRTKRAQQALWRRRGYRNRGCSARELIGLVQGWPSAASARLARLRRLLASFSLGSASNCCGLDARTLHSRTAPCCKGFWEDWLAAGLAAVYLIMAGASSSERAELKACLFCSVCVN